MRNSRLNKTIFLGLILLSGCVQTGPTPVTSGAPAIGIATDGATAAQAQGPVSAPVPPPAKSIQYEAEVLIGATMKALEDSLGKPDIVFAEGDARFLRYDGPDCAVHILMEANAVIEVTPRARNGRALKRPVADDCFHEMVKARRAQ